MWTSARTTRARTGGLVSTRLEDLAVNVNKDLKGLCAMKVSDQSQYFSNCALTHPLTQRQSTDSKVGLMLGKGRGRCAVVQIVELIQDIQLTLISSKTCFLIY